MLTLRQGFVGDEFIELTRRRNRSPRDEARLAAMKEQMAAEVMSSKAREVYDGALALQSLFLARAAKGASQTHFDPG